LASAGYDPQNVANPADSLAWARAGFNQGDQQFYVANHFNPDTALEWQSKGFTPEEAAAWRDEGAAVAAAVKWKGRGISAGQFRNAEALLRAGYPLKKAVYYAMHGVGPRDVRSFDEQAKAKEEKTKAQEAYQRFVQSTCNGTPHEEGELLTNNPYTTKGRCYEVLAFVIQWLGPTQALMSIDFSNSGYGLMLVDFREPQSSFIGRMLVISEGTYSYTSASGGWMTVPHVRVLNSDR
jgi:hypothetical protein